MQLFFEGNEIDNSWEDEKKCSKHDNSRFEDHNAEDASAEIHEIFSNYRDLNSIDFLCSWNH